MNATRLQQLAKLRTLYELRVRASLAKLHEQQKCIDALKVTAQDIQVCIDEFINQLKTLDDRRLHQNDLTVAKLQEDAASRLIVKRDLGKERIYLKTANKDVSDAKVELSVIRARWHECSKRLDAVITLEKDQKKTDMQIAQLITDRELDDLALTRHGTHEHG